MEEKFRAQLEAEKNPNRVGNGTEIDVDTATDSAVDKIVNEESDKLIQVEDDIRARQFAPPPNNSLKSKIKSLFLAWWDNKRLRYRTFIGLFIFFVISLFIPYSRYAVLNLAGVRVSSSLIIVDSKTGLPLKNIPVQIQNKEARSNEDGWVSLDGLKQGSSTIKVDKRGYAPFEKTVTLGWGSNPIGEQSITATGAQYNFLLRDWLSKKTITYGEATSGEDVAQANEEGRITLTVGEVGTETEALIKVDGYREERIGLDELKEVEKIIELVPYKKHAFVSNRDGEYDLYKIDADGKNEEILLKSTGKEREVPFVLPHPTRDFVAYVSSRDGDVNKDGFILDGLFVIDVLSGESYKVTRSEQLQVIGWSGNKLVFVSVIEGVSAGNSQRSKIVTYDLETKERKDIAASNYFNDVKLIDETVYYAPSSYAVPASQAKLFSLDIEGKNKKTVVDLQVWSIVRKEFGILQFNAEDQKWYEQQIGGETKKLESAPVIRASRIYATSQNKERALWVDVRDGKGVLLLYDSITKSEQVIRTEAGLTDPVFWVNDTSLIYRLDSGDESADYIMSIDGGESYKIADVVGNRSRYFY